MKLKKILALALVTMMVLAVSVNAMAESTPTEGSATKLTEKAIEDTLTIRKSLLVANKLSGHEIAYPGITYTYKVEPTTAQQINSASVTDSAGTKVAVKPGVAGGVSFGNSAAEGTIQISNGTVTPTVADSAEGQTTGTGYFAALVSGTIALTIKAAPHGAPGIYRYTISDTTTDETLVKSGIVRANNSNKVYYLDVYVSYETENGAVKTDENGNPKLVLGGYVLQKKGAGESFTSTQQTSNGNKEGGFDEIEVTETTDGGTTTVTLKDGSKPVLSDNDVYYTYNATLSKVVTGAMGDTKHGFPFDVTVSQTLNNTNLGYKVMGYSEATSAVTGNALSATDDQAGTSGTALKTYLKNGQTATIIGMAPNATIKYMETNDTSSTYTTKAKDGNSTEATLTYSEGSTATGLVANGTATFNNTAAAITDYNVDATTVTAAAQTVKAAASATYTNKLDEISPTNVVLRFAPYLAILAAGVAIFFIALGKRRKSEEE